MEERLQKIMARSEIGSRRKCEELISQGRVTVDGIKAILGQKADPEINDIKVNGTSIVLNNKKVYILLNKPAGYVCTKAEHRDEVTVMSLLKGIKTAVFPVGRLDKNTTGLLLLTNDGDFANNITHPSKKIDKKYVVLCQGQVEREEIDKLRSGIELFEGVTSPCRVEFQAYNKFKDLSTVEITIHEGRKRQVRRMFSAIDHPVKHLSRTALGNLTLRGVKEGKYRELTRYEIKSLFSNHNL